MRRRSHDNEIGVGFAEFSSGYPFVYFASGGPDVRPLAFNSPMSELLARGVHDSEDGVISVDESYVHCELQHLHRLDFMREKGMHLIPQEKESKRKYHIAYVFSAMIHSFSA